MDSFLEKAQQTGEFDSSGAFTLDLAASLKKIGLRSAEPSLWLLKGVQAGIAGRSPSVAVQLRRDAVRLEFSPTFEATSEADLGRALVENIPDAPDHLRRFLSHLSHCLGLALGG